MSGIGILHNSRRSNFCAQLFGGRLLLLCIGFILGLCCSQFLFLINFNQQSHDKYVLIIRPYNILLRENIDDLCLQQNKWGGFRERLAEQKRIFASVREEHIEIIEKLDESRHQLEDLQRSIPLKSEF